jgi:hypothetical protein
MLRSKRAGDGALLMSKLFCGLASVSLVIAAYLASTLAENNDLGWRAVLPAVNVLTIFAAIGLARSLASRAVLATGFAVFLVLSALPRSIQIVAESVRGMPSREGAAFAASPALWAAVRRHSGARERVANNPLFLADVTPWPVNISWALFSNRASCFAGREFVLPYSSLPRDRVGEIEIQFERVFAGRASADDVRELAERFQCRLAVLTPQDGAWASDPFADNDFYDLVDEKPEHWRIYRAK